MKIIVSRQEIKEHSFAIRSIMNVCAIDNSGRKCRC